MNRLPAISHIGSMIAVGMLVACSTQPSAMTLSSEDFASNGMIPSVHTCDGTSLRPSLTVHGVPSGTKSLAVIIEDPDVPTGTFVHWTAWNIDPGVSTIDVTLPSGSVEGFTSRGQPGYVGLCPPTGTHHYVFRVYAMNTMLTLPADSTPDALKSRLSHGVLAQAEYVGLYARTDTDTSASGATKTLPGSTVVE